MRQQSGRSPGDASPFGVCDLGGNAAEWTASPFLAYPGSAAPAAEFLADMNKYEKIWQEVFNLRGGQAGRYV